MYDLEGYSLLFCNYKYNDENSLFCYHEQGRRFYAENGLGTQLCIWEDADYRQ